MKNEENRKITNIYDYLKKVTEFVEDIDESTTVVYRGENINYKETRCQPNLFRHSYFEQNKFFERNLLDEMRSNKLTKGNTYLKIAVDAQHGGFPSRLLDVTYNSLVALYFAITPSIKKDEDYNDGKDGYVYIYYIKNLFCPSSTNINRLFDTIVNRDKEWICSENIFQRNHKLIDHIKINNRIIAQQGAFILFQGDEIYPIQESYYKIIEICGNSKKEMRRDLKKLFGIHTGSIYPDGDNVVKDIEIKSNRINNGEFSFANELELVLNNLDREIEYLKKLTIETSSKFSDNFDKESIEEMIVVAMKIEKTIYYYKEDLKKLKDSMDEGYDEILEHIIKNYNKIVENFINYISFYLYNFEIEINSQNLKINN